MTNLDEKKVKNKTKTFKSKKLCQLSTGNGDFKVIFTIKILQYLGQKEKKNIVSM